MANYRVLIVDDDRDIRHLFAEALRSLGEVMDILEMPSAEEAMLVTVGTHVDLLISDVYLPGISGLDLVKWLRKRNPTLKIILVTGVTDPKVKDEVANAGAAAFFYKPIDIQQLMQSVMSFKAAQAPESPPTSAVSVPQQAPAAAPKPAATIDLEGSLAALQEQLKAHAAALLGDDGIVLAHSGDFNAYVGPDLAGKLSTVFKAGLSVSRALKEAEPANLMSFAGPDYYLCQVPVGSCFSLVVVGGHAFQASLLSPSRRMLASATELLKLLETPKPAVAEAAPVSVEGQPAVEEIPLVEASPEDVATLSALFNQASGKDLAPKALDDYWNTLAEQTETDGGADQSILSYDEAQKRGLTPE